MRQEIFGIGRIEMINTTLGGNFMIGVRNVVAIVCGGGPAPGINAVISAVTNTANRYQSSLERAQR